MLNLEDADGILPVYAKPLLRERNNIQFFLFWEKDGVFKSGGSFESSLVVLGDGEAENAHYFCKMDFPGNDEKRKLFLVTEIRDLLRDGLDKGTDIYNHTGGIFLINAFCQ